MTKIGDQADKIAAFILGDDTSLNVGWLRYLFGKKIGKKKNADLRLMKDELLHFINDNHRDDYADVLSACDSHLSIDHLVRFMSPEKAQAVVKKLGLNYSPEYISTTEVLNDGIGKELADYMSSHYGYNTLGGNAVDTADLLHAASFLDFAKVSDSHNPLRPLADYLSSSNHKTGSTFDPGMPSLDAVLAFFNSYDDKQIIEDILFDIEKRSIFNTIASQTKPKSDDPDAYADVLDKTLDDILHNLEQRQQSSELDGAKRISQRLIDRYAKLQQFKLEDIRNDLNGWAFPRFYQAEAILDIAENKRFLIADEMGTGKTAIAVLASEYIAQQTGKDDFKTLIVTTNTNKRSLVEKIQSYLSLSDEEVQQQVGLISSGDRRKQYEDLEAKRYVVINYELLRAKDWKLEDYEDWEVEEIEYSMLKGKLDRSYRNLSKDKKKQISEFDFALSKIPVRFRKGITTLKQAHDVYVKIKDLDRAKTVAKSLDDHVTFDHVVVDEIQNAKNDHSLNSRAVAHVTSNAEYVTCLTGTPFVNGLSDLGNIFDILGVYEELVVETGKKLEKLETKLKVKGSLDHLSASDKKLVLQYRKNFKSLKKAVDNGDVRQILLDNPRIIRDYLRPKMLRRRSQEVLKINDLQFNPPLEDRGTSLDGLLVLPMFQRMTYQILQSHDFGNSSDQLRALQMMLLSGGLYNERFRASQGRIKGSPPQLPEFLTEHLTDEHAVKYEALEKLVETVTSDSKKKNVVVFSSMYKKNVTMYLQKRLKERFGDASVLRIDGDVKDTPKSPERTDIIRQFNESEQPTVLLATLPTMKEAIELHNNCSNVVFLDFPFTWAEYSQGVARVWRADQDEVVDVHNLVVSDSLDIGKLELILDKRRLGELLLHGLPINEAELDILDLSETSAETRGFIERYVNKSVDSSLKIMRDLYSAGAEKIKETIGERNSRSEVYANAYILNLMSVACLRDIAQDMIDQEVLDVENPQSLDGKVLDLAGGYGGFAHATNIGTENLEINPFMVERAEQYAPTAHYTTGVMQDVRTIYGDDRFEAVIFSLALHYASDEEKGQLLYDIHKTMKTGGKLFLTESSASIDETGRNTLEDVLTSTGYSIVKSEDVKVSDKTFYKVIAEKTGESQLYEGSFALREYVDEDTDVEVVIDLKDLYKQTDETTSREKFCFGEEFGPNFEGKIDDTL